MGRESDGVVKYECSSGRVRPFVEDGPSLRSAGNLNSADPSHFGVTAGAGLEMSWRTPRFTPRVRYTRWAKDPMYAVPTRPDQVELLVGIAYAGETDAHPFGRRISVGAVFGWDLRADTVGNTSIFTNPYTVNTAQTYGATAGAGVEFRMKRIRIARAVRFHALGREQSHGWYGRAAQPSANCDRRLDLIAQFRLSP